MISAKEAPELLRQASLAEEQRQEKFSRNLEKLISESLEFLEQNGKAEITEYPYWHWERVVTIIDTQPVSVSLYANSAVKDKSKDGRCSIGIWRGEKSSKGGFYRELIIENWLWPDEKFGGYRVWQTQVDEEFGRTSTSDVRISNSLELKPWQELLESLKKTN